MERQGYDSKRYLMGWVGGKNLIRKLIALYIPDDLPFYAEPFGGTGGVMLYKHRWAQFEVINDLNSQLVCLWKYIKYHPKAFLEEYRECVRSREMVNFYSDDHDDVTELMTAVNFFIRHTNTFGATGRNFMMMYREKDVRNRMVSVAERISDIVIENMDFEEFFRRYAKKDNFFYCDPPYVSDTGYATTRKGYKIKDTNGRVMETGFRHERLSELLHQMDKIGGKFLLSYNDCEEVRELYKDFNFVSFKRKTGIENRLEYKKEKEYGEVLIGNYDLQHIYDIHTLGMLEAGISIEEFLGEDDEDKELIGLDVPQEGGEFDALNDLARRNARKASLKKRNNGRWNPFLSPSESQGANGSDGTAE